MAPPASPRERSLAVVWSGSATSESGREDRPDADIVFVHGLNGDRFRTWTTRGGVFWPKDLLPKKLGNCRIMTFGYNADLGLTSSSLNLRDFAVSLLSGLRDQRQENDEISRPLIFVCHSLGGIVVKKALLVARVGDPYSDISRSTVGLVFFGTPHRGATIADFGAALNSIARFLDRRDLISSLSHNNQALLDISQDFVALVGTFNYSIKTFYEENKIGGIRLIVSRDSATMNITQEEALPIEGDHREMCRFDKVDDSRFGAVWNAIRRLIPQNKATVLSSSDEKFLISIPGVDVEECLQRVKTPFSHSCDWVAKHHLLVSLQTSRSLHVLHILGKPGSGKSTLAGHLYRSYFNSGLDRPVFFFSFAEKSRNTAVSAWGCLLRQLLEYDPGKIQEIKSRSRPFQLHTWSEYRLQKEFEILAKRILPVTSLYIIDAIDECDITVDKFLGSVESILDGCEQKTIKFIFFGRRQDSLTALRVQPRIAECLATMEVDKEPLQRHSIRRYVEQKVEELCVRRRGLQSRKGYIVQLLCEKSEGMYLLPELAIASLRFISGYDADVMAELEKTPPEIRSIYRKALDEVIPQHRPTVSNLLLWVTFGFRHMSEQEMSFALASTADTSVLRQYLDNHLGHAYFDVLGDGGVQAVVGTLLKATQTPAGLLILELVHGTARQYLTAIEQQEHDAESSVPQWLAEGIYGRINVALFRKDPHPRPSSDLHGFAHKAIYRQCYVCLEETLSQFQITDTPDYDAIGSTVPFFSYASEYIFEHARYVSLNDSAFYADMVRNLSNDRGKMIRDCFWHSKAPEEHKRQPLIHFACELGLEGLVACLAPNTPHLFRDENWTTPLNTAAATGIVSILKLLCEDGRFHPTAPEKGGGTALHTAIYYGHVNATEYLIGRVSDFHEFYQFPRPADIAAEIDNVSILELFKSHGCLDNRTFFAAVRSGSLRAMDYLAQLSSIDLTRTDGALRNVAHVAAQSGFLSCMEWLELHGYITKHFDSDGLLPIHIAGVHGHHHIINFLVERGHAGIDDFDRWGITMLRHACRKGQYKSVRLAIQHGAETRWKDTNSKIISAIDEVMDMFPKTDGGAGKMALSKTVWVLLDLVPDLRDKHGIVNTPTTIAQYARSDLLEHLLQSRSEMFKDDARAPASNSQHQLSATRLIEVFIGGVNAVDAQGRTPLHNLFLGCAAIDISGHWVTSIDHLLYHGADLSIEDEFGMTPLDIYIYTLTGVHDTPSSTGSPALSDLKFSSPRVIRDGILKKFFAKKPQLLEVMTKRRGELLWSLGCQQRLCGEDAKLLLSCFTEDELDAWIEQHATAGVMLLLRAAGRHDEESVPFLGKMSPQELAAILQQDFFSDLDTKVTQISPLCQGALSRLRQANPAAICPVLDTAMRQLPYYLRCGDDAVLKRMQINCLPDEISGDLKSRFFLKAAETGNIDAVCYLVETCSVDVDSPVDHRNRTALSIAVCHLHLAVVEYLLGWGASIENADSSGATALHWAVRGNFEDNKVLVKLLLDHGAQITDEIIADLKSRRNTSSMVELLENSRL